MPKPDPVVLHAAFWWECPLCGHEQFGKMDVADLTQADAEEAARAMHGLEPWQELPEGAGGDLVCEPKRVTCSRCGGECPVWFEERDES